MFKTKSKYLITTIMMLTLMLLMMGTVNAAVDTTEVTIYKLENSGQKVTLNGENPYLVVDTPAATGTLGSAGCIAYFDDINNTLTLQDYNLYSIIVNGDITVKLIGNNNEISQVYWDAEYGIASTNGDVTITSDADAKLTITASERTVGNYVGIGAGIGDEVTNGKVIISGKADVTININNEYTDKSMSRVYGIYAHTGVEILENASCDITVRNQVKYTEESTNGIYVDGTGQSVIINTEGNVNITTNTQKNLASTYDHTIYNPNGTNTLTSVGTLTLKMYYYARNSSSEVWDAVKPALTYTEANFAKRIETSTHKINPYSSTTTTTYKKGSNKSNITVSFGDYDGGVEETLTNEYLVGETAIITPPADENELAFKCWETVTGNPVYTGETTAEDETIKLIVGENDIHIRATYEAFKTQPKFTSTGETAEYESNTYNIGTLTYEVVDGKTVSTRYLVDENGNCDTITGLVSNNNIVSERKFRKEDLGSYNSELEALYLRVPEEDYRIAVEIGDKWYYSDVFEVKYKSPRWFYVTSSDFSQGLISINGLDFEDSAVGVNLGYESLASCYAQAKEGYAFVRWDIRNEIDGSIVATSTANPYEFTITEESYCTAIFEEVGIQVSDITVESASYGYADLTPKTISLFNKSSEDVQIKSVVITDTTKFTVVGTGTPTIAAGATNTDFSIKPVTGLSVGTYGTEVIVTDMNDNEYTATVSFEVEAKDITSTITIEAIPDQDFTGSEIEPTIVVKDGTTPLTIETDYTVAYENNINRGTATVKIAPVDGSNYTWTGEKTADFTINPKDITSTITIDAIPDQDFTGSEIEPTIVVKDGTTLLELTTDYTVTYSNNINKGTEAKVTLATVSTSNYTWTTPVEETFNIVAYAIKDNEVALESTSEEYTGTDIEPTVTVTVNGTVLTEDTDYTVTYDDNINVGTATVTVEGKGNYGGTVNKEFTINPMTITPEIGTIANQTYTGSAIEPKPVVTGNGTELIYGDEYTESYENNINVGTATLKILPVDGSNYTWTVEVKKDFEIIPMTITPTIADITAVTFTNEDITPELEVTGDSKTLVKDTDYTVAYENNKYVGTATAKITANPGSNYTWTGEITKDFTINPATSTLSGNPADVTDSTNTSVTVLIGKTLDVSTLVTLNPSAYQSEVTFTVTDAGSTGVSLDTDGKTLKGATAEGTVTIKASFAGMELNSDSNLEYSSATDLTIYVKVVDKEEVTIGGLTYADKVYDGIVVTPTGTLEVSDNKVPTNELIVKYEKFDSSWTEITELSANVGKYRVTYSVSDTNENYTGSKSYEFKITVRKLTKPTLEGTYTYTGSAQTATLTGFDGTTMEVSNNTRTDAGSQNIEVTLKDTTNYSWDDDTTTALEIPFEIAKEKLTKPTLEGTYTYTGEEQTAVLVNVDNETMNVTNNTRTEVGNQNIEVTLKDTTNYSWDDDTTDALSIPFEIAKATPTITLSNLSQKVGSVTAATYTVAPEVTDGTVKVEYKVSTAEDSTYTETLPTAKGTYTVRVSVAGDTNLEDTQNTATLTITQKTSGGGGGGGSTTTKYTITVKQNENGKISPETTKVEKGENQKFEIKANEGYEVEKVLVDGKSVGAVKEYTFENVKAKHTIEATFKKVEVTEETWKNPFTDVKEKDWYYEAVKFANENKLFNGVSSTEFGPNVNMTRGMLVTVLYRLEGEPATNRSIPFADVDMSMYYANAISWAKQNNIVNGVDETNFAPNAQISREQLVAILYRYAKAKGMDVSVGEETNILSYDDVNQVSEYAIPAMQWGCGAGIITGRTQSTLAPQGTATRAEVATMLMRFVK